VDKAFHDILVIDDRIDVIDNTNITAHETADAILRLPWRESYNE
jgi:hypothetical protein